MEKKKAIKIAAVYAACIIITLLLVVISIGAGSKKGSFFQIITGIFTGDGTVRTLISVNMPRTLVAFFSGVALSVSGILFQSVTRNKFADPAIIGVSSAGFTGGLVATVLLSASAIFVSLFSVVFGLAVFALVFWFSYERGVKSNKILALGAAVNAIFMMLILTIAVMQNFAATNVILSLAGSLAVPQKDVVITSAIFSTAGVLAAVLFAGKCNVLMLGDKTASGLGLNVLQTKMILILVAVFLAATAAVNVGITAFLGLLAPLIARKILGANHYNLIPLSALLGGLILLSADCFGRALGTPVTLPVGIIVTVVGGCLFIALLGRPYNYAD
jgi:iron complex transport system permease protein